MRDKKIELKDVGKKVKPIDCPKEHLGKHFILKSINQHDICELEWINPFASMGERYLRTHKDNLQLV